MLAVHEDLEEPLFQKEDCLECWHQTSPRASDNVEIFETVVKNARDGVVDEDIDDDEDCDERLP